MMSDGIQTRKTDHLRIAVSGRGAFERTTTLLDEVTLVHQALPEMALDEVDLSVEIFGRTLRAPLLIGAMTGGTQAAERLNADLASVAEELGVGLCLGSQRVMEEHPESAAGFAVRDLAPNTLIIGNLGLVQARQLGPEAVGELSRSVSADAMALHLNPAQELTQAEGDRDFRGGVETLCELRRALDVPLMVKETGCGLSREAGEAISAAGVEAVEVGGAGGTSWVRVESERDESRRWLGDVFSEWGVPTAASLVLLEGLPLTLIAGGGLRDSIDLARSLALGACACSVAQPVLSAYHHGGPKGARLYLSRLIDGLRTACLLTGCRRVTDLASTPRIVGPQLERWLCLARGNQPAATGVR